MDPFYQKYLDAYGLPIVSSEKVPNEALFRARDIVDEMLTNRPDIRTTLASLGRRVTVVADGEVITDVPEFKNLYEDSPGTDWNPRVQGGGVAGNEDDPTTAIWQGNLLCNSVDVFPHEDIVVHELAHTILNHGVERQRDGEEFKGRLLSSYQDALDAGLWKNTYAGENPEEYWAEGVQSWFGLNDPPGPIHNHVNTRVELEEYDPALAGLITEVFGDATVTSSCHQHPESQFEFSIRGVLTGPGNQPLAEIGLWAWQGSRDNSGYGRTVEDGSFLVRVPKGEFTLDIHAGEGCSFVGWYDGEGITSKRSQAYKLEVVGEDVKDVIITLPGQPDDLPRIEWCAS